MGCNQSSDGQWAYPVNGNARMVNGAVDVSAISDKFIRLHLQSSFKPTRKEWLNIF